jgi:hypothetical protein
MSKNHRPGPLSRPAGASGGETSRGRSDGRRRRDQSFLPENCFLLDRLYLVSILNIPKGRNDISIK